LNRWQKIRARFTRFSTVSFSQEGEDLILKRFFSGKRDGFYVDVGAHHPRRFSNTYLHYLDGWRGINIDASPDSIARFKKERPRDLNLVKLVSNSETELSFYLFHEGALNTTSESLAKEREKVGYPVKQKVTLRSERLKTILVEHVPPGQKIDFMSVDVEGEDLNVLQSNDWAKYRPTVLLVEMLGNPQEMVNDSPTHQLLRSVGYQPFAKTFNTYFFSLK
jgi:FkbM family methyltransferase